MTAIYIKYTCSETSEVHILDAAEKYKLLLLFYHCFYGLIEDLPYSNLYYISMPLIYPADLYKV